MSPDLMPVPTLAGLDFPLLDPRNDYVFKRIFADDPALLSDLINAIRADAVPIHVDEVLNPRIEAEHLTGKFIVLDVLVHDDTGFRYNVEIQVRRDGHWPERITYYVARAYVSQLASGEDYKALRPTLGIHLMGFEFFDDPQQASWRFEILECGRPDIRLSNALQWNLIELPKADRLLAAGRNSSALAAWVTFFQHGQDAAIMKTITHPPVQKALEKLERLTSDEQERHNAWMRERALHDEATFLREAREEGLREGLREGIEEGRKEAAEKIARQLIDQLDLDDDAIARLTGLSDGEVRRLRQPASD